MNVALDIGTGIGDNVGLVVRAFGNVSFINASDPHFNCVTGFACNKQTLHNVDNRYVQCTLRTPVELSDNGRIITVTIDNIEKITVTITCK